MTASAETLVRRIERLTRERNKARNMRQFYDKRIAEAVAQLRECEVGNVDGNMQSDSRQDA